MKHPPKTPKVNDHLSFHLQIVQTQNNFIMENFPHTIIELPANRSIYKKGQLYDCFYELVQGEVALTISQNQLIITHPIILGDYEIIQGIDYRLSLLKTLTKCIIKVYDLKYYSQINLRLKQFQKAFDKFHFKSKLLKYWLKKLFFLRICKRNDIVGKISSIGIILQGSFKIHRNIPIVKMKANNLQLLKRFQICLMSSGEVFDGSLICQSNSGVVGICDNIYSEQLSKSFEQFSKILQISNFKGEVHNGMEKQIAKNCRKKQKIFSNMVPLPLKNHIRLQQQEEGKSKPKETSRQMKEESMFQLQNNISQFLHKQWRKGLSLSIKRKDVSPALQRQEKSPRPLKHRKKMTVDITNPALVNFEMFNDLKKIKSQTKISKISNRTNRLPEIRSTRFKTESNQVNSTTKRKYLYFQ